jgi:hypothetical protein
MKLEGVIFKGLENFQKETRFLNEYITGRSPSKNHKKINDTIVISRKICKKLKLKQSMTKYLHFLFPMENQDKEI